MNLLIHPKTQQHLEYMLAYTPQALLIVGPPGAGKYTLAQHLGRSLLGAKDLTKHPYVYEILEDKGTITIEHIRDIKRFLRLRTTGTDRIRRVIIMHDAQGMTHEAQNALLKSLEQPPDDTVFIVTATDLSTLLPTILSRLQQVQIYPLAEAQAHTYFAALQIPNTTITKAYHMSGGWPGLMTTLINDDQNHPLAQAITEARTIMTAQPYERLLLVDELAKQKPHAAILLDALLRLSVAALHQAGSKQDKTRVKRLAQTVKMLMAARAATTQSGNLKLILTDTFLQM